MLKAGKVLVGFLILLMAGACTAPPSATPTVTATIPAATVKAVALTPNPASCVLSPIIVPTRPATTPGYTELDPSAGLHMTGTPQEIDVTTYRLKVTGKVERPLSLTYDDLRCLPKIQTSAVLICPGFFEDEANWAGASLMSVLDMAGVQPEATSLLLVGADQYATSVTLQQARTGNNHLAYEWEGKPIPILHGFPVRAVFPSLQGNTWVKWLVEIQVE